MFKTLFATTLLLFGCANKCNDQTEYYSNKREVIQTSRFTGSYNYKDYFDDSLFVDLFDIVGESDFTLTIENNQNPDFVPYVCPIDFGDNASQQLYLSSISFHLEADKEIFILYDCFDLYSNDFQYIESFYLNNYLNVLTYPKVIFNYGYSSLLNDEFSLVFNMLYTKEENVYTKLYTGYYSLNQNVSAISNKISVFGSFMFNNNMYLGLTNKQVANNTFDLLYYDVEYNVYDLELITLPLGDNIKSNQFYFTGVRLTVDDYTYLSGVGVFGFVRDTSHDNDTFYDLLFGVMDSPLYFIHMLLSFELFGVELYVAFASLLTLLLVLIFIRKFL